MRKELKEILDDSRYFPKVFWKKLKTSQILFVHSYPNLDCVLKGGDLIDRAEPMELHSERLIVAKVGPKVKKDTHVFLGAIRLKGVAMGYVVSVKGGVAVIQGMGGDLQK